MKGLEIVELKLSELENYFTIGAEYYSKYFTESIGRLKSSGLSYEKLEEITSVITDGDHSTTHYTSEGILYLLSEAVNEGYVDKSKSKFISKKLHKELQRSALQIGDVLVSKTGVYFGKSAVVNKELGQANTSAHVGIIRLKDRRFNPYYLSSFFNSKYGRDQLRRRGIKVSRPEIKLLEFDDILIPLVSDQLQKKIEWLGVTANKKLLQGEELYANAQQSLLIDLGLSKWRPSKKNYSIKKLSDSFNCSGRLDAEYYQPRYYEIEKQIRNYKHGTESIASCINVLNDNVHPLDQVTYKYIEIADIDDFGNITSHTLSKGNELPSRARRLVRKGDVIISAIEGSLEKCALVSNEHDRALCSTGFYVVNSKKITPETLLVLFKSFPLQEIMKKNCSGTILTSINKNEFTAIDIPIIHRKLQKDISRQIQKSLVLRRQSNHLFEISRRAVEVAIEKSEKAALDFIKSKL